MNYKMPDGQHSSTVPEMVHFRYFVIMFLLVMFVLGIVGVVSFIWTKEKDDHFMTALKLKSIKKRNSELEKDKKLLQQEVDFYKKHLPESKHYPYWSEE